MPQPGSGRCNPRCNQLRSRSDQSRSRVILSPLVPLGRERAVRYPAAHGQRGGADVLEAKTRACFAFLASRRRRGAPRSRRPRAAATVVRMLPSTMTVTPSACRRAGLRRSSRVGRAIVFTAAARHENHGVRAVQAGQQPPLGVGACRSGRRACRSPDFWWRRRASAITHPVAWRRCSTTRRRWPTSRPVRSRRAVVVMI